ncbi:MAG: hypothetical protein K2O62_03540 [Clostridia bacterium]|nr:hypothetical protein [Clostridia bacterium]
MADNQIVENSNETIAPETENAELAVTADSSVAENSKKSGKFVAGVKEWFRKLIVKLKRKTQLIPLALTLITSFVFLCMIGTFSQLIQINSGISSLGICMFVSTLASILVLPLFLNAFPKNKKPVIAFIVAVFVVFALIIAMDVIFLVNMQTFFAKHDVSSKAFYNESQTSLIVHIVLVGICVLSFAFLPLYKKAINKINTKKVVSSNDFSDEIDTSAEV